MKLSNKDYHTGEGLSASGIKEFLISPAHYMEYKSRVFDETVKLESLVHLFILEPETFDDSYAIVGDRRTKEGKAAYESAIEDGKLVVKQDDVDAAMNVALNATENPTLKQYLSKSENEVSIFHQDEELDIKLKIRPDILIKADKTIIDIKTISRGMNKYSIESLVRTRGWDIQAAFYLYVANAEYGQGFRFLHAFIEKDAPYGVRFMKINDQSIENAFNEIAPALQQYKKCLKNNEWPSYSEVMDEINVYKFNKNEWENV